MKQKKIGNILYVFDTTAYQITEDTDAAVIKIQLECIPAFEVLNESLKDKFEPINYKLFCVKHPEWADYLDDYTVSVSVTGNGAVSASPTSGDEGEEITLTVTPESGYELNTMTAASGGTAITITDNKFTMPAGNVTVTATFQGQEFDITCAEAQYGTVSAPSTARLGDTVNITTTPDTGYILDTLTAMCGDVPVTISDSTFTMPAGDVTITATFVQDVVPYEQQYFTIESVDDNNVITIYRPDPDNEISSMFVSENDGANWNEVIQNVDGLWTYTSDTIDAGDKLLIKANSNKFGIYASDMSSWHPIISGVYDYIVYGNIMSLFAGDNFYNVTFDENSNKEFCTLFAQNVNLLDASNLVLPNNVTPWCYDRMFYGCTSLTTAPALPATTLAINCYEGMFSGCTSLTTAPALPATTLAQSCYKEMFYGCTSLTTAPALPATTVAYECYKEMFSGCTSLTTAPALPATSLSLTTYCYEGMFKDCTSLVTAPALPATTLMNYCYRDMFSGCTSLTTAPALPATSLKPDCYNGMFSGCTSLTTAPILGAGTVVKDAYKNMFNGCSSLDEVVMLGTYIYSESSGDSPFSDWLGGTTGGTIYKNPNWNPSEWPADFAPSGWSVEDYEG